MRMNHSDLQLAVTSHTMEMQNGYIRTNQKRLTRAITKAHDFLIIVVIDTETVRCNANSVYNTSNCQSELYICRYELTVSWFVPCPTQM